MAAFWEALERRHFGTLTFPEVRRSVQALSGIYVARRGRLATGFALEGAGKRAAFAVYYGALHYLTVCKVVESLHGGGGPFASILDLGCGTGVAGAAWALASVGRPRLSGVDLHPWAVSEAVWTYRQLGVHGQARRGDIARASLTGRGTGILAAFSVNELDEARRDRLLTRLLGAAGHGAAILVVEPIARAPVPWWGAWSRAFALHGGEDREWRLAADLPEIVKKLDRAAGLDHVTLTARTLWLRPRD